MMAAKRKKSGQSYTGRVASGRSPLSIWVTASTLKQIATLRNRWGFGYVRDVIAEAVALAAKGTR